MFTFQLVLVTDNFNLHVYGVSNEIQFTCLWNHLHVIHHLYHSDLSQYICRFAVIFMCICHQCHSELSWYSCGFATISVCICHKCHLYLSPCFFLWICEEMPIYMIQICHNIKEGLTKAAHESKLVWQLFGYLPRTYVEASLKGWPNNHVGGIFSKSTLFLSPIWTTKGG